MGMRLIDARMDIERVDEIKWKVGKFKEAVVTQSLVFRVYMPNVDKDDLNYLTKIKGVNAWIMRLIVQRGSEEQDLGSLYARFTSKKSARGQTGGTPTSVTVKIYYAAAYPSERFRSFNCPAFEHNKRISKMSIQGNKDAFDINIAQPYSYPEKSHLVELTPSSFNAGNSLVGKYFIEIAPYNFETKMIYDSFKRIPMHVEVLSEENQTIKSCSGIHPERTQR